MDNPYFDSVIWRNTYVILCTSGCFCQLLWPLMNDVHMVYHIGKPQIYSGNDNHMHGIDRKCTMMYYKADHNAGASLVMPMEMSCPVIFLQGMISEIPTDRYLRHQLHDNSHAIYNNQAIFIKSLLYLFLYY